MKKHFVIFIALMLITGVSAFAMDLKVNVPFDFVVGSTTVPAGEYLISSVGNYSGMRVQNFEAKIEVMTLSRYTERMTIPEVTTQWTPGLPTNEPGLVEDTTSLQPNNGYTIVLTKYGDQYFLKKAWYGLQGREFVESKLEEQLKAAHLNLKPETIVLIATVR